VDLRTGALATQRKNSASITSRADHGKACTILR
jgi:hypothetical protein